MKEKFTLPSVAEVIAAIPDDIQLHEHHVTMIIRERIAHFRGKLKKNESLPAREVIVNSIVEHVLCSTRPSMRPIINGTGIVLHTGFGRAPISKDVLMDMAVKASGYVNLEFDLPTGNRGNRLDHTRTLISSIVGSEDSAMVNNNAAAVLIALNTFAEGKEVIVSRGQQVEIGGSFRIPDIIQKSHCKLVEIGTTNRTHLNDYEKAITKDTGLILWVHTSNYTVKGFTKDVDLAELVALGRKKKIPVMADLGSGAFLSLSDLGLPHEIPVEQIIKSGVDIATFSGDKLLGGPQSGILSGKKKAIKQIVSNPLYRAMRCDKITLTLLDTIVRSYKKQSFTEKNLALQLMTTPRDALKNRARDILESIEETNAYPFSMDIVESDVEAGSGSLPEEKMDSIAIKFTSKSITPTKMASLFREATTPVVGYISKNKFFIDLKAILPEQDIVLCHIIDEVNQAITGNV